MSNVIGIDVSKASLDCAYLRDVDQSRAKRKTCQNNVSCFPSLVAWAEAKSELPIQALAFIIEPTHVYHEQLVQFLHNTGATVYLVSYFLQHLDKRCRLFMAEVSSEMS